VVRTLVVLALLAGVAHADKLADARQAIADVRYDDAQRLLAEALRAGGNSPAALADIYQLAATVAVVLDQRDAAEHYDERWLALDPTAKLPGDLAPKLREPFVAAQAAMQARGSLDVRLQRAGVDVDVVVVNDPLAMAVSVGAGGPPVPIGADRRARIAAPPHGTVVVLDDAGNHLRELPIPEVPQEPPLPPPVTPPKVSRGWFIATGVSTLVFVGFGIAAIAIDDDVTGDLAHSETHHLDDVQSLHSLERVFVGVTIASGAAMIISAIPLTRSILRTKDLWISPSPVGVGLTVTRRW
jgi:hypothetical protein